MSLSEGADAVVTVYPGNRYEIEYRYTGFVDLQSRPTWPRFNLAHLAKVLNGRERAGESPPEVDIAPPGGGSFAAASEAREVAVGLCTLNPVDP